MSLGVYDVTYRAEWKVRVLLGDRSCDLAVKAGNHAAVTWIRTLVRQNVRDKFGKRLDMFTDGLEGITFERLRTASLRDRINFIRGKEVADNPN